jgi:hypothetical protein
MKAKHGHEMIRLALHLMVQNYHEQNWKEVEADRMVIGLRTLYAEAR